MNKVYYFCFIAMLFAACVRSHGQGGESIKKEIMMMEKHTAIFAGGCFWCVEGPFMLLEGVESVSSGYMGGQTENPTYKQVCTGTTGHAEVVKVVFDSSKVSYDQLLEVFFTVHDPTQLNRQGNDIGTQYRSAIFPLSEEQREVAKAYIAALTEAAVYDRPIVTSIEDADVFYIAEDYHQDYFNKNPEDAFCLFVAKPKLDKVRKLFADRLKK